MRVLASRPLYSFIHSLIGVHSRTLTQACYGLPLGSRWAESIRPYILPAPVAAGLPICAMRSAPLIGQQTLVDYARGCQSTTHRPLNCRCDCKRARTEHGSDAADMPGQYAVSRAPRSHTVHIRFSGVRTLKCARGYVPAGPDQEEIELARARRDSTALPRPRPSQHEPAACGGGRRGDRPRRRRDPRPSDCCDDFTERTHTCSASV